MIITSKNVNGYDNCTVSIYSVYLYINAVSKTAQADEDVVRTNCVLEECTNSVQMSLLKHKLLNFVRSSNPVLINTCQLLFFLN